MLAAVAAVTLLAGRRPEDPAMRRVGGLLRSVPDMMRWLDPDGAWAKDKADWTKGYRVL